jgi:hypothetical protein
MVKMWVYAPRSSVDEVRLAIGSAGGGRIGNYSFCAFVTEGTGYFMGNEQSSPAIGCAGKIESVPECRIEFVCAEELVDRVKAAIKKVHPYEEVPIDVLPLL